MNSSSNTIRAHVRLEGGHLVSEKNARRLRLRSTRPIKGILGLAVDYSTYRELYLVHRCRRGWGFREITHGMGINGYQPTLRRAVLAALATMGDECECTLAEEGHSLCWDESLHHGSGGWKNLNQAAA